MSEPTSKAIKLESSWLHELQDEFTKPYFLALKQFLGEEKKSGQTVYPPGSQVFAALDTTPFKKVKVVILGQDPYHGAGQAHGLCFSVNKGIAIPPSLGNIYKELHSDIGTTIPKHGYLMKWAEQGVLLLNATLTVRANQAGSHQNKGWEIFTDTIIKKLSDDKENLVFLLWGRYAQNKAALIDHNKHLILKAAHPSPFSAYNGFMGCKHFSKTNDFLESKDLKPIDWQIE